MWSTQMCGVTTSWQLALFRPVTNTLSLGTFDPGELRQRIAHEILHQLSGRVDHHLFTQELRQFTRQVDTLIAYLRVLGFRV